MLASYSWIRVLNASWPPLILTAKTKFWKATPPPKLSPICVLLLLLRTITNRRGEPDFPAWQRSTGSLSASPWLCFYVGGMHFQFSFFIFFPTFFLWQAATVFFFLFLLFSKENEWMFLKPVCPTGVREVIRHVRITDTTSRDFFHFSQRDSTETLRCCWQFNSSTWLQFCLKKNN